MLNKVTIEGVVTQRDANLRVARIAVYRDGNKRFRSDGREMPDYVSIRYPLGRDDDMAEGNRVVVHGFLQSRDFQEPLGRVLRKVGLPVSDDARGRHVPRVATEVVAEKVIRVSGRNGSDEK